jgi:hypothetical protein
MLCRVECLCSTVYTQQLLSSLGYTFMTTCFGSLLIHLQVTYHFVDYVTAMLLLNPVNTNFSATIQKFRTVNGVQRV